MNKKYFIIFLIHLMFFCLIAFAIYFTSSLVPLWALLLIPEINLK